VEIRNGRTADGKRRLLSMKVRPKLSCVCVCALYTNKRVIESLC
jgi:hypothetical protein